MIKRNCLVCGKEFKTLPSIIKKGYGKFCSRECSNKGLTKNKINKKCQNCKKEFKIYPSSAKRGEGKFCSHKCYWKFYKGKNHPLWKGEKVKQICRNCGKEFMVYPRFIKRGLGRFCSCNCSGTWINRNSKGKNHPQWKERIEKKCLICGKKIFLLPYRIKKGQNNFCSGKCRALWINKHMSTKNTSIELKVEEILKRLGIKYESQKVIPEGRTVSDFYIPEQRLVIYADGKFWHKSEWAKRKGVFKKDATQDLLLGLNGYQVLRLGEDEINDSPHNCKVKIQRRIKNGKYEKVVMGGSNYGSNVFGSIQ